jgi:hypothetical protein
LLSDLRPYSCISEDCKYKDLVFESREKWIAHELNNHYQEWWCEFPHEDNSIAIFHTEEGFVTHLEDIHPTSFTDITLPFLVARARHPSLYPFTECPFCNTKESEALELEKPNQVTYHYASRSKNLQKHIGIHLQNFALFALLESDEKEDAEANSDKLKVEAAQSGSNLSSIGLDFVESGSPTDLARHHTGDEFVQMEQVPELEKEVIWSEVDIVGFTGLEKDDILEAFRNNKLRRLDGIHS